MKMQNLIGTTLLAVLLAVGALGCDEDKTTVDGAQAVAALDLTETQDGALPGGLLSVVLESWTAEMTGVEVAAFAAEAIPGLFEPAGCATATATESVLEYGLAGCLGTHGIGTILHKDEERDRAREIWGRWTLEFAQTETGMTLGITGTEIGDFDRIELTEEGTGEISMDGTTKLLALEMTGSGTDPRTERPITKTGSHERTYNPETACAALRGHWSFETPHGTRWRKIGFERCGADCPTDGSWLYFEGMGHGKHARDRDRDRDRDRECVEKDGKEYCEKEGVGAFGVAVKFDGSATAHWYAWSLSGKGGKKNGKGKKHGTVELDCTP